MPYQISFNTQPPEGGWVGALCNTMICKRFQHTAARRRLAFFLEFFNDWTGFNTQPPEGGWLLSQVSCNRDKVSTHSRPKAAGGYFAHV